MITKRFAMVLAGALLALAAFAAMPACAAGVYLFDLMKQPAYRKAYLVMMAGQKDLPSWLKEITGSGNYVTAPADKVTAGGATYLLINACKAHECDSSALEVMFSQGGAPAYALLIEDSKPRRWFGNPNAAQKAALSKPFQ